MIECSRRLRRTQSLKITSSFPVFQRCPEIPTSNLLHSRPTQDAPCLLLICPEGAVWQEEQEQCLHPQGSTCCTGGHCQVVTPAPSPDSASIFRCWTPDTSNSSREGCQEAIAEAGPGISYPGYKQFCRSAPPNN